MARASFAQRKRFIGDFLRIAVDGIELQLPILGFLLLLIVAGGVLIGWLDGMPVRDGTYLAFITALTIGYGDVTPDAPAARLVAVLVGVLGLALSGLVVAVTVHAANLALDRFAAEALGGRQRRGSDGPLR